MILPFLTTFSLCFTTGVTKKEYKEPWVSVQSETIYAVLFIYYYCFCLYPMCV